MHDLELKEREKCLNFLNIYTFIILNTFLFLFSNKILNFTAGIHKMLVKIETDKPLTRLLPDLYVVLLFVKAIWRAASFRNFRTLTLYS